MAKTLAERNKMQCNVDARKRYDSKAYTKILLRLRKDEAEALDNYLADTGESKNGLIRGLILSHIGFKREE